MEVIQVVKRFGLCGGMEEYAYKLACELSQLGAKVHVICEEKIDEPEDGIIEIVQLGKSLRKPRWLSHLIFAKKVRNWVMINAGQNTIIHSHERINCHHVTTIHTTLYNFPPKRKFPSLRNYLNEHIESRELNCASIRKIVPVSSLIADQITEKYSSSKHKLAPPIPPGVSPLNTKRKEFDPEVPVIGFMGKEWRRKGLPKVIEIWRELRKEIPLVKLWLAGFNENEKIGLNTNEIDHVRILGFVKNKESFYQKIDLLLHPAKLEAFGMIVPEALSLGIPVLSSKETGASKINPESQNIISCKESVTTWAKHIKDTLHKLSDGIRPKYSPQNWSEVANSYVKIYEEWLNR